MKSSTGKKIVSMMLVALMIVSGLVVISPLSDHSTAGEVMDVQSGVSAPSAQLAKSSVLKDDWMDKIEPSLRENVNMGSRGMVDVTILTTDMGKVNTVLNKYVSMEIEGKKISPSFRDSTSSGVPLTRTVTLPYYALEEIATLPDVYGIYRVDMPVPAVVDSTEMMLAQEKVDEIKMSDDDFVMPMDYSTALEHGADIAWGMGYEGSGVNVAVVDTGVDFANPDLMGQWAVDTNPASPYYGWPIMWDPVSMDLLLAYFTADNDWYKYPYPIFASWGESSWYSDTTYVAQKDGTDHVNYTNGLGGFWTKRYDPMGYGNGVYDRISRNYYVGNITSASGNFHLGIAKDDHLTEYIGERVGILVVDSTTPGVYDTVYVDLNNNLDFTDDKPVNKSSPLAYDDIDNDGIPDISGGLLYFIANTEGSVVGEEIMNGTASVRDSAALANGHVVTDVDAGYSLWSTLMVYLDGTYMPIYSEPIYQDVVLDGTGVAANSVFYLNDTSLGFSTYSPVNFTYLNSAGFGVTDGTLELYYGNATDEVLMVESDVPGMFNYTFDPATGAITLLFDLEDGSYIYALYQMDTYSLDFTTGEISFMSEVPAGVVVTADYDYGLSLPYSDTYAARMGYDNFIPASGDLVAFFGDFDYGQNHGTLCASSVVGTWTSWVSGTAPAAKIIGIGDFYMSAGYDAWYFAVEGYDGIPDTGDEAQIVSNSFGSPGINEDGWNYASRLAYDITTNYAPNTTFVVAAGNDGWGYGTVTSPGSAPGVITAGAGINMAYRWLFGYDGGEPDDWMNYFAPDSTWYGDVADFSGRGPTALGTPDPDVLAVGEFAIGALPLNDWAVTAAYYGWPVSGGDAWDLWAGTSLATPVTAGVLALIYQAYYDNHNNTWPSGDNAKTILTSSCDDHGYDPLQQGAGWVNASLAVQMAAEASGVSSDTMYWTPGDYNGEKLDASIHLLAPGETDSVDITLTNHDPAVPATVDLSDAYYMKSGELTFEFPMNTYGERILKADGVYYSNGTKIADLNTSFWNNADFMKVTAYFNSSIDGLSGAFPYMELSNWMDREHYGGNETAFDSTIIPVVNETVMVGQYGETYAFISNLPLLPSSNITVYSNDTLLNETGNYTFDATTGQISFINSTGDPRPLWPGEVINVTYTYYLPVNANDYYIMGDSPVTAYTVWFTNETGNTVDWTAELGTNFTFDATTGNITLLIDLQPGEVVTVDYYWAHAGVYDGKTERIRMNVNLRQSNVVSAGIYDPANRVDDGLVISIKDVYPYYYGLPGVDIPFWVTVEFYQKADWSWMSTNVSSLTVPAGGSASFTASMTVPADTGIGAYEGAIVYQVNGHTSIIPVLVNVPATTFPVHFGGNVPTTSLYENGAGMGGYDGGASGDWRFYFVDVTNLKVDDTRKLLLMDYWNGLQDDWEMYLFASDSDPYFSGGEFGDFTMKQVAGTKDALGVTDTLAPGSEILSLDMMNGPFEIALRSTTVTGDQMLSENHGDMGYMTVSPTTVDIYTNELAGSVPITAYSNIDLYGGLGSAVTSSEVSTSDGEISSYPYTGGTFVEYLAAAPISIPWNVPDGTISINFHIWATADDDYDLGIFFDANGDGVAQPDEFIQYDADADADEQVTLMFPEPGTYLINIAGYTVVSGIYNLEITRLYIGESAFHMEGATETVPAGTPAMGYITWDFGDQAPTAPISTLLLVSPGVAPYALVEPVNINFYYDDVAPAITTLTPASGDIVQSVDLITASFSDSSPIDVKASSLVLDGSDVTASSSFTEEMVVYRPKSLEDGLHTVTATIVDKVGNTATMTWSFTVDSTAPYLSASVPEITSDSTVLLTGTTEPTATVTINGVSVPVSSDGTFSYEIAVGPDQTLVDVIATDIAGNTAEITRTVTFDDTAPGLNVVLPTLVSETDTMVSGSVTGLDAEVGAVTVTVNGVPVEVYSDGTFYLPVTLSEGENTFTIVVVDGAGNSYSVVRTITLDTTAPSLAVDVPSVTHSSSLTVTGTATGASKVLVNGKQVLVGANGTFSATVILSPGDNVIMVSAMDASGNMVERTYSVSYEPVEAVGALTTSATAQTAPAISGLAAGMMAVLLILGIIIGFVIRMFMGGGARPEEPVYEEMEMPVYEEPVPEEMEEMPAPPEEEVSAEAPEVPSEEEETPLEPSEAAESEIAEVSEPPVEDAAVEEKIEGEPEEPSEESPETEEAEEEEKGEVLDLSDI